jgi:RNA 2',3'-cyclic 3'-phosphodiesterase
MRLFVALELPAALRQAIDAWRRGAADHPGRVRWVAAGQLHLTLGFLSEVAAARLGELSRALASALAGCAAPRLEVIGGGAFPERGPVGVLWVGVRGGEELIGLQRIAATAAEKALDLPPERRPFHPHVTLGRCRDPWPRRRAEAWFAGLPASFGEPFTARDAVLIRSELSAAGAVHSVVASFPLRGATA